MKLSIWALLFILSSCSLLDSHRNEKKYIKAIDGTMSKTDACEALRSMDFKNDLINELLDIKSFLVCEDGQESFLQRPMSELKNSELTNAFLKTKYTIAKNKQLLQQELDSFVKIKDVFTEEQKNIILNEMLTRANTDLLKTTIQAELIKLNPSLAPIVDRKNIFSVAKDYEKKRLYQNAEKLYREIISNKSSTDEEIEKSFNNLAQNFKTQRMLVKFRETIEEAGQFFLKKKSYSFYIKLRLKEARAWWTEHNADKSEDILNNLVKSVHITPDQSAQSYWILASIQKEKNKNDDAYQLLIKAKSFAIVDNELKERIYWHLAWNAILEKKWNDAELLLQESINAIKEESYLPKAKFWLAKVYLAQNKTTEANPLLQELKTTDEYNFYGIMATRELGLKFSKIISKLTFKDNPTVDVLKNMREFDVANLHLQKLYRTRNSIEEKMEALFWFHQINREDFPLNEFFKFPRNSRNEYLNKYFALFYPNPYLEQIKKISRPLNFSPYFVNGIIRQESAFNPTIRSWADAYGLMQVIPELANVYQKKHNSKYSRVEDLFNPEINLPIGITHLSELFNKYNNSFIKTVCAYNANPAALKRWIADRYRNDPLEFIESIPYDETRNYVKLVMRNLINYQRMEEDNFDFPETLLSM